MSYRWDPSVICPKDKSATPSRVQQYGPYYGVKHAIASEANPKVIVEIGVRCGYSAWAFLTACPKARYHGFDAENGTHGGRGGPWTWWAEKMLAERGFDFELHVPFDTQKVDRLPARGDFYHIDGDHSPEGVRHDLDICFEDAPAGAVILVDDYDYAEAAGVREGVDAWLKDNEGRMEWEHRRSLRGEMIVRKP
jgi:hypothetical protein